MIKTIAVLVVSVSCALAQQTADLHVSASALSKPTLIAMFGKNLPKGYSAVQVDVCSNDARSLAVPLGLLRQTFHKQFPASSVTILSNAVASQVIVAAQGSSKTAVVTRIVFAVAGAAAVGAGFSGLSTVAKTALTSFAVDGPTVWNLFSTISTPAALISYPQQAMAETLDIAPNKCLSPSVQIIEGVASSVDFDVYFPVQPALPSKQE